MFGEEEEQNQFEEFFDNEEEEESIDSLPTEYYLTAFPEMVNFKPCYQGIFSHYTLYITNPSSLPQDIDIMLDPNSNFSISSNEITIQAGIVYSLIITFISDEIGIFETDLVIHTLYNTITIPLTAKCIPSPLLFNDADITQFQFSMAKTNLTFNIANCSLLTQLHVLFDFDTAAFSIAPPSIDLPPFSSCPIEIKYDPNFTLNLQNDNPNNQQPPTFHIQCTESGDSISIPLNIARPNTCGLIDFGCVPVGIKQNKSIKIYNFNHHAPNSNFDINDNSYYLSMILSSSEYPEISPPFSYQIINEDIEEEEEEEEEEEDNKRESKSEIIFSFLSKEVGDFSDTIQFGPLKYSLHAVAVKQPFQVKFSNDMTSIMYLKNITEEKKSLYLSYDDKFDRKSTVKVSIPPGESKKVDTMKVKQLLGNINDEISSIFVRWRDNDYKVVQEIQLPTNDIEMNEDSISFELNYGQKRKKSVNVTNKSDKNMEIQFSTDSPEFSLMSEKKMLLKPHTSKKVDIEFNPKNSKKAEGTLQVHTDKTITKVPLKTLSAILSSTNLINFLRIDDNQTSNFIVSFCGPKQLTIKKPKWITCEDVVNSNEAVNVSCQRIPNSVSCGYLTINGKNSQPLSVPILAYLSSSEISFHVIRPFVLRVENHGLRTAFVTFTSFRKTAENEYTRCEVTPNSGFIPFNGSTTFTFSEETKYVLIHSGDEIMRQILSYLNPDHFYSRSFENIDILRDEISCIDIIDDIDYNEFSVLFDQLLSIQKIDVTKMNKDIFTTSTQKIDFGEVGLFQTKEVKLWIENEKLKPIELHLSSQNQSLRFPSKIFLKSEQRFCLRVSFLSSEEQEINDTLVISCVSDFGNISKKHILKNIEIKGFVVDTSIKFEADVLNFGVCEVGRINRGKLRLVNRKKEKTKMTVSASPPFSCPKKKFIIEPGCFVLLPIHFTPLIESPFQGRILFEPENSHRFYIPVIGFASFNPEQ